MNMLAATLLLITPDEGESITIHARSSLSGMDAEYRVEQAYYLLQALLNNLLPPSYFTPDLLASRAYQLVLEDYVKQLLPRVYTRLGDLGVDLAGITFGWFLSLFTDCLGVEVGSASLPSE
jgi:hypothetical protein